MPCIYYSVSRVTTMFLLSSKPWPSGSMKQIYNSFCDVDEESVSDIVMYSRYAGRPPSTAVTWPRFLL
jgi:hypothetical protein